MALAATALLSACASGPESAPPPPETKVDMVTQTLHGVSIEDPYRWLEDEESPETKEWVERQHQYAREYLGRLPHREKLRQRLTDLLSTGSISVPKHAAGRYFYFKKEGQQNQPLVYMREGIGGEPRVLLDPNQESAEGTVRVDWLQPSKDGKLLAYGKSEGGSETSDLYVLNVDTGEHLPGRIPKVRFANPQWLDDGSGFYYSRPRDVESIGPGEEVYFRRIYFHKLGADFREDELVFGDGLEQEQIPDATLSPGERYLLLDVFLGWGKNHLYVKERRSGRMITIAEDGEFSYSGQIAGDTLYLLTNWEAPRYQVFAVDLKRPRREHWKRLLPEGEAAIQFLRLAGEKLFAGRLRDAHAELLAMPLAGGDPQPVPLPGMGTMEAFESEPGRNEAFFEFNSFTTPPVIYRFDASADLSNPSALTVWDRLTAPVDSSQFAIDQVFYESKDGTRVPMFVIRRNDVPKDGSAAGLLYGYGGFNIAITPRFPWSTFPWIPFVESGGVLAIANLRGGSEYGEEWHRAGMLGNKQNVFDDFIAAAEYLKAEGWAAPGRLAIHGRSNGGLLVGAAMTQRPDLFQVVVCGVPLLDMLRYHEFRMARLWISEYGSAEDPEQFEWLRAYSPYHNVSDGRMYPATLIYTGETDSRVDPMHARKMVARLQAASASGEPILLRFDRSAGHGGDKPMAKIADEWTDIWAFVFQELGMVP